MRTEQIVARALEILNDDRYMLANLVFARVKELSEGATPLVDLDVKTTKLTDIAIAEIAEGKIVFDKVENIPTGFTF